MPRNVVRLQKFFLLSFSIAALLAFSLLVLQPSQAYNNVLGFWKSTAVPLVPSFVQYTDQNYTAVNVASMAKAYGSNVTSGNLLVVYCNSWTNTTTITASDSKGNTYTAAVTKATAAVGKDVIFYAIAGSSGANTVTCSFSPNDKGTIRIAEYANVAATSPVDATNTATGTGTAISVSVTTTLPYDLIIGVNDRNGGSGLTSNVDFLQRSLLTYDVQDRVVKATGSISSTYTIAASETWNTMIVAFKWNGKYSSQSALYIAGGIDELSRRTATVLKSINDGVTWTSISSLPAGRDSACFLKHKNAMWVIGGYDGSAVKNTVYKSSDNGFTWASVGTLPAVRNDSVCLSYNNLLWVIGGTNNNAATGAQSTVWSSPDGITWTSVGNLPETREGAGGTVYNGKMWILGGKKADGNSELITRWSTDGITWSNTNAANIPNTTAMDQAIVHTNLIWNVGSDVTSHVWSCGDPCASWTVKTALPTTTISGGASASINGKIVFVGSDELYSTTDGTSWTTYSDFTYRRNYIQMIAR